MDMRDIALRLAKVGLKKAEEYLDEKNKRIFELEKKLDAVLTNSNYAEDMLIPCLEAERDGYRTAILETINELRNIKYHISLFKQDEISDVENHIEELMLKLNDFVRKG